MRPIQGSSSRASIVLAACVAIAATAAGGEPGRQPAPLPAFPGAEGFGSTTPGGRGGRVITVTNLRPDGPGSLQAAVMARGPRTVVFAVGGLITADITVLDGRLTIAGQTAPDPGITIRGMIRRSWSARR